MVYGENDMAEVALLVDSNHDKSTRKITVQKVIRCFRLAMRFDMLDNWHAISL